MKWFKENWFKLVFALLATILTLVMFGTLVNITSFFVSNRSAQHYDKYRQEQKDKEAIASEVFDRKIKCQDEVDRFKKRYGNVTGGRYDQLSNSCDIEYLDNGKKETSNMEFMSDN